MARALIWAWDPQTTHHQAHHHGLQAKSRLALPTEMTFSSSISSSVTHLLIRPILRQSPAAATGKRPVSLALSNPGCPPHPSPRYSNLPMHLTTPAAGFRFIYTILGTALFRTRAHTTACASTLSLRTKLRCYQLPSSQLSLLHKFTGGMSVCLLNPISLTVL